MGNAIRAAVALQETAGLDVITDGEWWRKSYIGVIAELAHGFELSHNPADGRPWTVVVDKLSPKQPGFIAKEIAFLKKLTKRRLQGDRARAGTARRADVGPGKSRRRRIPSATTSSATACRSCAAKSSCCATKASRSCRSTTRTCACSSIRTFAVNTTTPTGPSDFAVDMDNQVVDGINGVKLAVHLCRRAGARARGEADHRGGYDPILRQLGRLKVDHITMEFTSPGAGDMSVFKRLPENVEIGLGCVSCQPGQIDSAETIVSRVETALAARRPGADHAQPRLRLRPRLGRRSEPRRGLHEAQRTKSPRHSRLREKYG